MKLIEKLARDWTESDGRDNLMVPSHIYQEAFEAGFRAAREMAASLLHDYSSAQEDEILSLGESEAE